MLHATSHSINENTAESRASRPLRVAESIKGYVVSNALQPGDKLPNEAELIELFGMAKGTIREAMRILEAQGLVKTRTGPGGGCFVHEVSETRTRALLANYFYFRHLTISDIYARHLIDSCFYICCIFVFNQGRLHYFHRNSNFFKVLFKSTSRYNNGF